MKRLLVATGVAAAIGAATLPAGASAGPAEDLVGGVQKTVNDTVKPVSGLLGGGGGEAQPAPAPASGTPPTYVPPAHGTNPHGQGTVATTDLPYDPETGDPLEYSDDGPEEVIVGRARGEQNGDAYHGHITIVSTFLTGELIGVDTDEGETEAGPLEPLQEAVLDALCDGSGDQICLEVLTADSETTEDGSTNRFAVADVAIGGPGGITATAAESNGNISDDGECQTAQGDSNVADASLGGALTADVLQSGSESTACNDGTETQENTGQAPVMLNSEPLPIPLCDPEAPNSVSPIAIPGLVGLVCNADDSDGAQMDSPYGVREAAAVFLLEALLPVKATTAASESHAVAPGDDGPECPDPNNPDCPPIDECPDPTNANDPDCPPIDECPDPDNPDCPDTTVSAGGPGPGGPGGPSADDGPDDELAFTGADLGTLGAIGLGVMAIGLALMAAADRRRRTVA